MMMVGSSLAAFLLLLLLLLYVPYTIADVSSDSQALLAFASLLPHARSLNWNSSNPICASWTGITCTHDETRVITLRLPGFGLSGPLPGNTIGKFDALLILSLRSNALHGYIPLDILSLPSLHSLDLQNDLLSGIIPPSLSPSLIFLDLSSNSLSGSIPTTLQNLTHLTFLNLQNNHLTGPIPHLPLSLRHLNLSFNSLNGSVTSSVDTFPASSFTGNKLLCGRALYPCSGVTTTPSPSPSYPQSPSTIPKNPRGLATGAIIGIAFGGLFVLFLLLVAVTLCRSKRRDGQDAAASKAKGGRSDNKPADFGSGVQEAEKNKLVFFEGSYNFDLEDLLRASAEVLGKGSYGTT